MPQAKNESLRTNEIKLEGQDIDLPNFPATVGKLVDGKLEPVTDDEVYHIERLRNVGEPIPEPYRVCQYFGMLVTIPGALDAVGRGDEVLERSIKRFANAFNQAKNDGLLKYGQLGPPFMIQLAQIDASRRFILLVYAFSDETMAELNKHLGFDGFCVEGGLPVAWPENT